MPWIESNPRPEPIQMTGEAPPNPFRTWKNDAADAAPFIFLAVLASIVWALAIRYGPASKAMLVRMFEHLRTPVK